MTVTPCQCIFKLPGVSGDEAHTEALSLSLRMSSLSACALSGPRAKERPRHGPAAARPPAPSHSLPGTVTKPRPTATASDHRTLAGAAPQARPTLSRKGDKTSYPGSRCFADSLQAKARARHRLDSGLSESR